MLTCFEQFSHLLIEMFTIELLFEGSFVPSSLLGNLVTSVCNNFLKAPIFYHEPIHYYTHQGELLFQKLRYDSVAFTEYTTFQHALASGPWLQAFSSLSDVAILSI